jgi:hypothetical protein
MIKVLLNIVNSVVFDGLFFIQLVYTQWGWLNLNRNYELLKTHFQSLLVVNWDFLDLYV